MSDALANRILARTIHAIETLGSSLEKHNDSVAVCLQDWGFELVPAAVLQPASKTGSPPAGDHQASQNDASRSGLLGSLANSATESTVSSAQPRWRCYMALPTVNNHSEKTPHSHSRISWPALAAWCEQSITAAVPISSLALFTGSADADLEALHTALSELRHGVVESALIIAVTRLSERQAEPISSAPAGQPAWLVAGIVLHTSRGVIPGGKTVLEVEAATVAGIDHPVRQPAVLTIAQVQKSGVTAGRPPVQQRSADHGPLDIPCQQSALPVVLLSLLTSAEYLTANQTEADSPLSALMPELADWMDESAVGLVLSVQHTPYACKLRLRSLTYAENDQAGQPVAVRTSGGQRLADQLTEAVNMLEHISGYPLRQLTPVDQAGQRLAIDSLMAAEFASRFQQAYGKPFQQAELLDRPSPAQILQRLEAHLRTTETAEVFVPRGCQMQAPGVL